MNIEIISIGDELLDGSVKEGNANYISKKLKEYNIIPHHITIVGDNLKEIVSLLKAAKNRSEIIFITGGLGPTNDDITRNAIADAFNLKLKYNDKINKKIKERLKTYHVKYTDNNNQQAMIPENAIILNNFYGTAPGFIIKKDDTTCITMPGVPSEMKNMLDNQVFEHLDLINGTLLKKELYFKGIGEAQLENLLYKHIDFPDEVSLSFVVKGDHILVKINSKNEDSINKVYKEINNNFSQHIFNNLDLPETIFNILNDNNLSLSVAESCTGGLLGNRITNIPGSSNIFKGGIIAYSNELKQNLLNINKDLIKKYGAVSYDVAKEMAVNIKNITGSSYGIGITGIAGPTGGTKEKPVGLVFIAVSGKTRTIINKYQLKGRRKQIKYLSTEFALKSLKSCLKEEGYNEKK